MPGALSAPDGSIPPPSPATLSHPSTACPDDQRSADPVHDWRGVPAVRTPQVDGLDSRSGACKRDEGRQSACQGDWVGAGNPRLRLTESCWLMAEYHALNFRGGVAALDFAGPTQRA